MLICRIRCVCVCVCVCVNSSLDQSVSLISVLLFHPLLLLPNAANSRLTSSAHAFVCDKNI